MPKIIPKQTIEEIRGHNDIVDVVGSYLQLKRAGSNFRALCPFHNEKTPSFNVHPHRQIFHCFGCGAGGDVFAFVMQYEGVEFMTAAKMLAQRGGVNVEFEEEKKGGVDKEQLYRLHEDLTQDLHLALLKSDSAKAARAYLEQRKLSPETIEAFRIGYAPESAAALKKWAADKKYPLPLLESAGLLVRPDSGGTPYARFRNRLMFPILNESGRVIGFSGRVLSKDAKGAKYVNSPDTLLFSKKRVLFALNHARHTLVDQRKAILVEGQLDAMRCHEAGITNAVAAQGTAITEEQARLIKRYADEVVLILDSDTAGENAALRSAEIFLATGLTVTIAALPVGEDPDSLILNDGAKPFQSLIDEAKPLMDFQVGVLSARPENQGEAGQRRVAQAVLDTIRNAGSGIQQDQLIQRASEKLGIAVAALRKDLTKTSLSRGHRTSRIAPKANVPPIEKEPPLPREEELLLEIMVQHPEVVDLVHQYLPLNFLQHDLSKKIIELLFEHHNDGAFNLTSAFGQNNAPAQRLAARLELAGRKVAETFDKNALSGAKDLILKIAYKARTRDDRALRNKMASASEKDRAELELELHQIKHDLAILKSKWEKAVDILEVLVED